MLYSNDIMSANRLKLVCNTKLYNFSPNFPRDIRLRWWVLLGSILWLRPPQRMSLGIEDEFIEADQLRRGEDQIEVLERLGGPKTLQNSG